MKRIFIISLLLCIAYLHAQHQEWHVKPLVDNYTNPALSDGTSLAKAWCLKYALSGAGGAIHPGDVIWLHGDSKATYTGTPTLAYKGHFVSSVAGAVVGTDTLYVKIASYPGEWAVIDGNIHNSSSGPVTITVPSTNYPDANSAFLILNVIGNYVHFDDFEITCLGDFSRIHEARYVTADPNSALCTTSYPVSPPPYNFHEYVGIEHNAVSDSIKGKFTNLVIRNIPGVAFGSWKFTTDSEIYGNIFYNNGLLDVTGVGCSTTLQAIVAGGLHANSDIAHGIVENCRGHQASIYTQNMSTTLRRKIRNNIFSNGYDSGLIIWSANDTASSGEYVQNYNVFKNVFINNGSPERDNTSNMIISTNYNTISHIKADSNILYNNDNSSGIAGMKVDNAIDDIVITNNYIFNGTAAMTFSDNNHGILFQHNFYAGKHIQVYTSIANYKASGNQWSFDYNTYFTKFQSMYQVPSIPATDPMTVVEIPLVSVTGPGISTRFFRDTADYNDELHSSRTPLNIYSFAPSRTIINQNKYNANKFYVSIYNGTSATTFPALDFTDYDIPAGRHYIIRDVQNHFVILTSGTYGGSSISFPIPTPGVNTNIELPLPVNTTTFGPYQTLDSNIVHSNRDFNTYVVEFDCPGLAYDLTIADQAVTGTVPFEARHSITFGPNYTQTSSTANVTAKAETEIRLAADTWIKKDTNFWASIDGNLCSIPLDETLEKASLNTNPTNIQATGETQDPDPDAEGRPAGAGSDKSDFNIYPNPSTGAFNVESKNSIAISRVTITRADNAAKVFDQGYRREVVAKIDISKENSGLFIVQVFFENESQQTKTFIKK